MFKKIGILFLAFTLAGCSAVVSKVVEVGVNDLERTSALAEKYGKSEVKQCADFLVASSKELSATEDGLKALMDEPTSGIFSSALKGVLVKEYLAKVNDPARQDKFRAAFDANCRAVAGQIVMDIVRDIIKVGKNVPKG